MNIARLSLVIFAGLILSSALPVFADTPPMMPGHMGGGPPQWHQGPSGGPDRAPWMQGRRWDGDRGWDKEECERGSGGCPTHHSPGKKCFWMTLILVMIVVHILLAVQVAKDLARSKLSWVWVVIVLLAGLPATAVYALMRIGNLAAKDPTPAA